MKLLSLFEHFVLSTILSTGQAPDLSVKELSCLTEAVYFEAGNQSQKGKEAVAHVILNRTKSSVYPDNVCEVTTQKGQFSYHTRGKRAFRYKETDEAMNSRLEASAEASIRAAIGFSDPTRGATHFINPRLATDVGWLSSLRKVAVIGDHSFYTFKKGRPRDPVPNLQRDILASGPPGSASSPSSGGSEATGGSWGVLGGDSGFVQRYGQGARP